MKGLGSPAHELRARATKSNVRIGRFCTDNALQSERDQTRTFNGTMKVGTKCVDLEAGTEVVGESDDRIEVWKNKGTAKGGEDKDIDHRLKLAQLWPCF